ncbi:proton-conducting transporter membrane subunit [Pseudoruegeria sp. SHC-113]|uniref:proton-conducting transporter transmembrane domain-containing protein n=1 Tax=Pseudoruegeria sp. SHC-113 TaxID=2855439 RepID=UPI0021BA43B6|nr:proton-conducting transporter membrane subunit [Pseudoruegeria sp. SHC-113]MCT8161315.1 oxidoreductase [Pseudoruegeria sp. SHC-113]
MFPTIATALLAPLFLILAALVMALTPGRRPATVRWLPEAASLAALLLSVAAMAQLLFVGPAQLSLVGDPIAIAFASDAISATMALLVAFIGWIVMRYARSYLDGEAREGRFHSLMLATLAAVLLLVLSASLPVLIAGFLLVGAGIRQLLLFYPERAAAQRAAAKFSAVWHAGDAALVAATLLLGLSLGASSFDGLATAAAGGLNAGAQLAVALIVLAALLKTAAFPVHGWLTEVMEAPTPVSALLHAGIINAGGVMLIRLAELVQASPGGMAALVMLGGLTALFGAVVMLTQSAVKTALAWSTVAQMGFMLLQCGLGLWALALLHIVAHSLYKAHAFLSSGGAVQAVAALRRPGPVAVPGLSAVLKSFAIALAIYATMATGFGLVTGAKSAQALALGTMLIFGVAYLVAQGLADAAPAALTRRTALASFAAATAYFGFQLIAAAIWGPYLPAAPTPGALEWALIVLTVVSFGFVAFAQALFPHWSHHPASNGMRVHLANGLYLNALLDRLIGGFKSARLQ